MRCRFYGSAGMAVLVGEMLLAWPIPGHAVVSKPDMVQNAGTSLNEKIPVYEIVSIRPSKSEEQMLVDEPPDGFVAKNVTLQDLIGMAYADTPFPLPEQQLSGAPGWARSARFDIVAKVDSPAMDSMKKVNLEDDIEALAQHVPTTRMRMLQAVLADRFKMKAHYETRDLPVYELVVAKGGSKLKESESKERSRLELGLGNGHLEGKSSPLSLLSVMLMRQMERPVIDKTGLAGYYDYKLRWAPDRHGSDDTGVESAPEIFAAIQDQMGLKLEATKGPVKVLVIDRVERPSEN